jgi:hypothetical protein
MKNRILLIAFLLCNCIVKSQNTPIIDVRNNSDYIPNSPQNDTVLKLFRSVGISNDRKLILQSNIDKLADITRKVGNNYYSLKKGTFGVADSMALEVNKEKKIIGIIAVYDYAPEYSNDTAYIHEQRKFRKIIAQGIEFHYTSKDVTARVTKWAYKTTTFELIEIIINGKKEIYSVIFDVELNYQKYKNVIDIKKNNVSLELLKRTGLK